MFATRNNTQYIFIHLQQQQYIFMKKFFTAIVSLCTIAGMFSSCDIFDSKPKGYSDQDSVMMFVDEAMNEIYLWKDKVKQVDWHDYSDPDEMMNDMKYKPIDRWSHVYTKAELGSFFTGESLSYGFSLAWYGDDLIVSSVYKSSEAYRKGLRRGYRISYLNGLDLMSNLDWRFFFEPDLGDQLTIDAISPTDTLYMQITADEVNADRVMHHEVMNWNQKKVGYIVYESFTDISKDSLLTVMDEFREAGVSELVIDLRYNGGGDVSVLVDWASKILPARYNGKPFFVTRHNKDMSDLDSVECVYPDAKSLGVERVFIITTENTASASEALINGLKPYVEVHQIGRTTHGKPVGMYVFEFKDWYLLPISFEYTNAVGQGGFFEGITPEKTVDATTPCEWGDMKDECLAQAREYIMYGRYSDVTIAANLKSSVIPIAPVRDYGLFMKKPAKLTK